MPLSRHNKFNRCRRKWRKWRNRGRMLFQLKFATYSEHPYSSFMVHKNLFKAKNLKYQKVN